jgi:hypothetical protein
LTQANSLLARLQSISTSIFIESAEYDKQLLFPGIRFDVKIGWFLREEIAFA